MFYIPHIHNKLYHDKICLKIKTLHISLYIFNCGLVDNVKNPHLHIVLWGEDQWWFANGSTLSRGIRESSAMQRGLNVTTVIKHFQFWQISRSTREDSRYLRFDATISSDLEVTYIFRFIRCLTSCFGHIRRWRYIVKSHPWRQLGEQVGKGRYAHQKKSSRGDDWEVGRGVGGEGGRQDICKGNWTKKTVDYSLDPQLRQEHVDSCLGH